MTGLQSRQHRLCYKMGKTAKKNRAKGLKTVFLVDGHALMRRVVAEWISLCSGLRVCGVTGSAADALRTIRQLCPDLVVSEIMRPRDLNFIRKLHQLQPELPILVFSTQDAAMYAARAREAGACGYVMKEAGGDKLIQSIRAALSRRNGSRRAATGKRRCGGGRTIALAGKFEGER